MMRRMGRRGLVGTMARTAVVAGTATAVSGGMMRHANNKEMEQQQAAAYEQQQQQAQIDAQVQQQVAAQMAAQQAAAAPLAPPAAPPAAAPQIDVVAELTKLGELKAAGILSDEEFSAAKAKLLA